MRMLFDKSVVIKEATEPGDTERLRAEAQILQAVAHPGIVAVCGLETDGDHAARLTLRRVDGIPASEAGAQPLDVAAGWAAALATTLADLHDLGFAHGALAADHVIIDPAGRPVLCSFGHAAGDRHDLKKEDVARLAALATSWLPADGDPALRRLHRKLDRVANGDSRRGGARQIATAILDAVPHARLAPPCEEERSLQPSTQRRPAATRSQWLAHPESVARVGSAVHLGLAVRSSRRWLVSAGCLATAAVAAIVLISSGSSGHAPTARGRAAQPDAGPVLIGHYRLDPSPGEDPVTVLGRWWCASATPAVLDVHSGTVWVFPAWPAAGQSARGEQVAAVDGAVGIAAEAGGTGCDRLVVLTRSGRSTAVELPEAKP